MRRPPITAILTAGACALGVAAPAAAQDGGQNGGQNAAGQRYLAWPTKGASAEVSAPVAPVAYGANPAADAPRRRAPIIPHGGFGRMPDTAPAQNLTPASAWLGPNAPNYQPVPPPQPQPLYAPAPQPPVAYAPPAPMPEAAPTAPATAPAAYYAPQPASAVTLEPAPTPAAPEAPAFDPMAPRRDAPIFRLERAAPSEPVVAPAPAQAAAPQTQPPPQQPAPQEGARYYSLHRQAGRQPDATPLPPTVYLDALPVELTTPPASADLAEPPAQPALIRNANGRLQAAPDTEVQDQP